jgi:hypothetical protein
VNGVAKDGYGQNLGNPSMPLERMKDFDGNRYKDHEERMHEAQMVSHTICNAKLKLTATWHLMHIKTESYSTLKCKKMA